MQQNDTELVLALEYNARQLSKRKMGEILGKLAEVMMGTSVDANVQHIRAGIEDWLEDNEAQLIDLTSRLDRLRRSETPTARSL